MKHGNHRCQPGCGCELDPSSGTLTTDSSIPRNVPLCWAIAGGSIENVAAGVATDILITIANYAEFRPRHLTVNAFQDDADGVAAVIYSCDEATCRVRVNSVTGLGRNVVGSRQGISGAAISALSDNYLKFGASIPTIKVGNDIAVNVEHAATGHTLTINADIEGASVQ